MWRMHGDAHKRSLVVLEVLLNDNNCISRSNRPARLTSLRCTITFCEVTFMVKVPRPDLFDSIERAECTDLMYNLTEFSSKYSAWNNFLCSCKSIFAPVLDDYLIIAAAEHQLYTCGVLLTRQMRTHLDVIVVASCTPLGHYANSCLSLGFRFPRRSITYRHCSVVSCLVHHNAWKQKDPKLQSL